MGPAHGGDSNQHRTAGRPGGQPPTPTLLEQRALRVTVLVCFHSSFIRPSEPLPRAASVALKVRESGSLGAAPELGEEGPRAGLRGKSAAADAEAGALAALLGPPGAGPLGICLGPQELRGHSPSTGPGSVFSDGAGAAAPKSGPTVRGPLCVAD